MSGSVVDVCIVHGGETARGAPPPLDIDPSLVEQWLIAFIRDEMRRRGFQRAVVGLSGGVDSAVTTYLAARALGPEQRGRRAATRIGRRARRVSSTHSWSSTRSASTSRTVDISAAVDGYLAHGARRRPGAPR